MLTHYLTMILRTVRREPISTLLNVLTLSLGLVCFVTAFAISDYWRQSERDFENSDRTAVLNMSFELRDGTLNIGNIPWTPLHLGRYLEADYPEIEAVARVAVAKDVTALSGDRATRLDRAIADPEFLEIFEFNFIAGVPGDALRQSGSVILTEETAEQLFGNENPLGRGVVLAGFIDTTVTGVIESPRDPSHLGRSDSAAMRFDLIASWNVFEEILRINNPDLPDPPPEHWGNACCVTYVLLPEDEAWSVEALDARLEDFGQRHVPPDQAEDAIIEFGAFPVNGLSEAMLNAMVLPGIANRFLSITALLLILGGLVLAVACVNYANLATARSARRAREVGLRKVVGANRSRVMFQYLLEASLLTTAALVLGVGGVVLATPIVDAAAGIDLTLSLFQGPSFWTFLLGVVVAITLIAGSYPAFILSRVRPVEALRTGQASSGPRFVSTLLVGTQFVAASFLLIAVIVIYAQNLQLRQNGLGIGTDPMLLIDKPPAVTQSDEEVLRNELSRLPQVKAITGVARRPWSTWTPVTMLSRSPEETAARHTFATNRVGEEFFSVFDMPLVAGRVFDRNQALDIMPEDTGGERDVSRELRVVIDRSAAAQLGFETPAAAIDEIVYFFWDDENQVIRIIGVVEDRPLNLVSLGATGNIYFFGLGLEMQILRLTPDDVSGAIEGVDDIWRRILPNNLIRRYFLDELFEENYLTFTRVNQVVTCLALFAVFIATIGLFAMAIQVASRRVREIGVRKTLGASTRDIVQMLLADFGKPVLIANLIAWPLAYLAATAYLNMFIQRVPLTPIPFVVCLLFTICIAWMAVGGQALRAARVRPAEVLRAE